ncbi:MAG: PIN domain-containing protein [Saccharofermentans sp.]|nr:PIN domain-containing protein [Saccharofermentans sp.]
MVILIDTNIVIDVATGRLPFSTSSAKILKICRDEQLVGFISTRLLCDFFYILRKNMSVAERKRFIRDIRRYLKTVIITDQIINKALDNNDITDFEDAIQYECAESINADYIVTRNTKDFGPGPIKAVTPEELLELLG